MLDIQERDAETISQLKLALTTHGFFTIDHGIADEVLKSSYKLSKDFFSLHEDIKKIPMLILRKLEQGVTLPMEKKLRLVKQRLI